MTDYEKYTDYVAFIDRYKAASNASSGSEVDANANVEHKNIATMQGELPKKDIIGTNRLLMHRKISEMYGEAMADEYIRQLEAHEIYKHDETSVMPYTYAATEVINVRYAGGLYTVSFERLYELCGEPEVELDSEQGVWAKYPRDMFVEDKNGLVAISRLIKKKRHRNLVRVKAAFSNDIIVTDNHPMITSDNINDTTPASNVLGKPQYRCKALSKFGGHDRFPTGAILKTTSFNFNAVHTEYMVQACEGGIWYAAPQDILLDRELGYLTGFFIGDGHYNQNAQSICIKQKEKEVLDKLAHIAYTHFSAASKCYQDSTSGMYALEIKHPVLVALLRDVFHIQPYACKKNLPENVLEYTSDFAIGLLEGLIDSDGTVESNGTYSIRLSSRTAILQIATIANTLGLTTRLSTQETRFGQNDLIDQKYQLFGVKFREPQTPHMFTGSFKNVKARSIQKGAKGSFDEWQNITNVELMDNEPFLALNDYIYDITTDSHTFVCNGFWVHNCVSITMYPFLFDGLKSIGGLSEPPKNIDSFCGAFINLVFAIAAQFAGAVSTPEFLTYLDWFVRKEYGDTYYLNPDQTVSMGNRPRTIDDVITDKFGQVVYSLNQPAAARNFQSVFWNIAYFDSNYFKGIFDNFVFPDGSEPNWDSVSWLQKRFMKWFNAERLKAPLTFPVETMNLLDNGEGYVDKEWEDFTAEMYAEGHSFFTYRSGSVDSLASCCRLRNELQDNTFSYTLGAGGVSTGSKGVITININRLVQNATRNGQDISEAVTEQVKKIHCYLRAFNEIMKDNFNAGLLPIYNAGYISLEKQFLTIGINGFVEGAEFLGIPIGVNDEYYRYGESILKPIYELNKAERTDEIMFNTEFVPRMCGDRAA